GDHDGPLGRELERVRREVEQHPVQRGRVPDPRIGIRWLQSYRQPLLLGDRLNDRTNRSQNVCDRERDRLLVQEPVTASQLDDVAGERAQAECGAVNEAELPLLDWRQGT